MKTWKRNAVVATVLLFVVAGIYMNWSYNREDDTPVLTDTLDAQQVLGEAELVINDEADAYLMEVAQQVTELDAETQDYFASVRLSRQEARDGAIDMLQQAAAYTDDPNEDAITTAAADLEEMVRTALAEAQIESLVISKGYGDCVAFCTDDGISLAVASPESGLSEQDVAKLTDIVTQETAYTPSELKIIEVG